MRYIKKKSRPYTSNK